MHFLEFLLTAIINTDDFIGNAQILTLLIQRRYHFGNDIVINGNQYRNQNQN